MQTIELFPNFKKRLILLGIITLFSLIVFVFLPVNSAAFILYAGLSVVAFSYCLARLFNRKPIMRVSPLGIQSLMSMNAEKIGLIPWSEITRIDDSRHFWFIKGIELHANEATAEKYQSRIHKKYRLARKTFLINLSNEEVSMSHEKLLQLVETYWMQYRNAEKSQADHG